MHFHGPELIPAAGLCYEALSAGKVEFQPSFYHIADLFRRMVMQRNHSPLFHVEMTEHGLVGPAQHYGHLPALAKVVLTFCMLAGRLELYTVAVLLTPDYWAMARKPVLRWKLHSKEPAPK